MEQPGHLAGTLLPYIIYGSQKLRRAKACSSTKITLLVKNTVVNPRCLRRAGPLLGAFHAQSYLTAAKSLKHNSGRESDFKLIEIPISVGIGIRPFDFNAMLLIHHTNASFKHEK